MNTKIWNSLSPLHRLRPGLAALGLLSFQLTLTAVTIVEDSTSTAPIIVFADAPQPTLQAANELADYIEKISGARPEVITGEPETLPESATWGRAH